MLSSTAVLMLLHFVATFEAISQQQQLLRVVQCTAPNTARAEV